MPRLRREEGAIALVMALVVCFLVVPLAGLAVDLGMQRVARRDMQSLSDVVALDLSRDVDGSRQTSDVLSAWGCTLTVTGACTSASTNRVGRSVDRNTSTLGSTRTVVAQLGCTNATGVFRKVGVADASDTTDTACAYPDAVQVDSSTAVKFSLMSGSGAASRTAVGQSSQTACYQLGSFAARFNTNDSTLLQQNGGALNDLLGVNLDVVSYQGLAAADLSLADLAADSHIGSAQDLLGGNVSLGDLIAATYDVLNAQGEPENSVALNLLNNPTAWLGANLSAKVDLSKLFGVSAGDDAALNSYVDVLDMLSGAIALANGTNALSLSNLGLLGITDPANSYVKIIQGKQQACGHVGWADPDGVAQASQINAHLEGTLNNLGLGALSLGVASATGGFKLDAQLGASKGKLVGDDTATYPSVHCGSGTAADPDKYNVKVTNSLASASADAWVNVTGSTTTAANVVNVTLVKNLLTALGLRVGSLLKVDYNLNIDFSATTATPPPTGIAHLQVPLNSVGNEQAEPPLADGTPVSLASANPLQVPSLPASPSVSGSITVTSSLLSLLGVVVGQSTNTITIDTSKLADVQPLVTAVTNAVNGSGVSNLTSSLNSTLSHLGKVLGLSLAGVDVYAVYRPTCHGSQLIG